MRIICVLLLYWCWFKWTIWQNWYFASLPRFEQKHLNACRINLKKPCERRIKDLIYKDVADLFHFLAGPNPFAPQMFTRCPHLLCDLVCSGLNREKCFPFSSTKFSNNSSNLLPAGFSDPSLTNEHRSRKEELSKNLQDAAETKQ